MINEPGLVLQRVGPFVEVVAAGEWVTIADEVLLAPDRDPQVLDVQAEGDVIVVCGLYVYQHVGPSTIRRAQVFRAQCALGNVCVPLNRPLAPGEWPGP